MVIPEQLGQFGGLFEQTTRIARARAMESGKFGAF